MSTVITTLEYLFQHDKTGFLSVFAAMRLTRAAVDADASLGAATTVAPVEVVANRASAPDGGVGR